MNGIRNDELTNEQNDDKIIDVINHKNSASGSSASSSQSSEACSFIDSVEEEANLSLSQKHDDSCDDSTSSEERKDWQFSPRSSSFCETDMSKQKYQVSHSGYLMKLGGTGLTPKNWRKRWFVLRTDGCLYYFKKKDEKPVGAIILSNYLVTSFIGNCSKQHVFQLTKGGARHYTFAAFSEAEMRTWMQFISEAARSEHRTVPSPRCNVHNVAIPALSITDPDCHGYIWKRGEVHKTWKRRYAVLKNGILYYYKDMSETTAIGLFCLHDYHVNETESTSRKYSIIAIPPESHMRTYYFSTENENDRHRWVRSLQSSIGSVACDSKHMDL